MPKLSDYLTVGDAADVLGVSKDTLRRWDRAGKLQARRHPVTGYRLYLKKELDLFLRRIGDRNERHGKSILKTNKSAKSRR